MNWRETTETIGVASTARTEIGLVTKTTKAIDAPGPQGMLAIRLASRESTVGAALRADFCSTGNTMTTGVYEVHWFCDTVLNHTRHHRRG
ncbi:MAG: hypothetical protein DRO73_06015 [Candidatus Thorarchaeota archaeon]|nr:MAG: hypothetical protein DRO73_06015 [Candidatus Thorarchaeota archaeon]RLI60000.1 MAG: hypothetical protein DRO93_07685 [Candidatus Thorarchaeota archaeon]